MAVSNSIKVTITGDASSLNKTMKEATASVEDFQEGTEKTGSKAKSILKGIGVGAAAAATAAAAMAVSVAKAAVEGYANYEQLVGGVETLFKDSADQVQKYASEAYKTAGLSANAYMEQATSFSASLLQGLGGDTKAAADYANQAIIDMADNANKMGTSIESIQNAYQGFAKQNYTMLDNLKLGYGGTRGEMERLIEDANKVKEANGEMADLTIDNFADMVEAIHIIQSEMGITGTTAEEASSTIQGSIASLKASWENLLVGMADENANMDQLIGQFVESASTAAQNLLPRIEQTLLGVAQLIEKLAPIIIEKLPGMIQTLLPAFLNAAMQILKALVKALPDILTMLITAIVDFLTDPETIMLIIEAAVTLFMGLVEAIPRILGAIFGAFGKLFSGLWELLKNSFGDFVAKFGEFIGGIFKGAINGILTFIENFINAPIDLLNGFIGLINSAFGWIGVNLGYINRIQLPRLEQGGIIPGDSYSGDHVLARVNSGEMVINREQQSMLWDAIQSGRLGEGGANVAIDEGAVVVNISGVSGSPTEIGDAVAVATVKAIRRAFKSQGVEPLIANAGVLR
ncbi:MAG: hypothetical protein IJI67_06940 [Clostridia bacterium]|nr:hypothetical protein [Clostridia bacterium]